jgi:excisionase family DNA binding protein
VPEDSEYIFPSEAAQVLHVSAKTVTRWANEGRIPCVITLGGHRRFLRSDIEAVAAQMRGEES